MTYFGHFDFWLLFLYLKLICPGIRKKHETYVAGGVQRISIFLETTPGLEVCLEPRPKSITVGDHPDYDPEYEWDPELKKLCRELSNNTITFGNNLDYDPDSHPDPGRTAEIHSILLIV